MTEEMQMILADARYRDNHPSTEKKMHNAKDMQGRRLCRFLKSCIFCESND